VCGCAEVETDWVFDHGWWRLDECPRCDHRWMSGGAPPPRVLPARHSPPRQREIASAA
jgi:hypothetical protein